MKASGQPAAFVRTAAAATRVNPLPVEVVEHAKLLIADAVAVALIARHLGLGGVVDEAARLLSGGASGASTVIGATTTLSPGDAAFVNGAIVHALDFDDTHGPAGVHPSAAVLPSALAAAEQVGVDGAALLRAYVVGVELSVRLGLLAPGLFHATGFHPTGILGTFGAALAAASVRGLSEGQTADALGVALSLAPLSPLEFMTDGLTTKRIHAGGAARAGYEAAALAAAGMRGPSSALEGQRGLLRTLLPPENRPDEGHLLACLPEAWGDRWHLLDVERKRYPVCHLIHPFLTCLVELRGRGLCEVEDIVRIECLIAPEAVPIVGEPRPNRTAPVSGYAARFSLPYVLASALIDGSVRTARFDDQVVRDPAVRAMAERIVHVPTPGSDWTRDGTLRVHRRSGSVDEVTVSRAAAADRSGSAAEGAAPRAEEKLLAEDPAGTLLERFRPVQDALDGLGAGAGDLTRLVHALRALGDAPDLGVAL